MRSGKPVNSTWIAIGKTRGGTSTLMQLVRTFIRLGRVKPAVFPEFTPNFTQLFSPAKVAFSPLIEHYFYPVSTGPINNPIKGKIKKGNK
jgi:hypothetical protein